MHAYCIFAVFALFQIQLSFASISVVTPASAIQCDPIQFSWQGGTGPWSLSILSSAPPNPTIEDLGPSAGPPFTWVVTIASGNTVMLSVQDSTGAIGQSSAFTIAKPGLGSACSGGVQVSPGGTVTSSVPTTVGKIVISHSESSSSPTSTGASTGGGGDNSGGGGDSSGGSTTSAPPSQGSSQASEATNDSSGGSQQDDSNFSSVSTQGSAPTAPTGSSTSASTVITMSSSQSTTPFNFNSGSGSSSAIPTNPLSLPTFTLSDTGVGPNGQIEPASNALPSGTSSAGMTGDDNETTSSSKKTTMSGPIIGGIIAAAVCILLVALCILRRCRRRRSSASDGLVYPFSHTDTEAGGSAPREMVGRSGYPASTFSSWGNHGDLDERAVTPAVASTEAHGPPPWEATQGTLESRYQAAFTPGHASSSSIDRNDPSSHQRFRSRAPIPKSMTDARHAEPSDPSPAIVGEQMHVNDHAGPTTYTFDEIQPQVMPSWGTALAGKHPVTIGYPPSYTSR